MGTAKITGLANPTAVGDAANLGTARTCLYATAAGGVKNAYTFGLTPALAANTAGTLIAGTISVGAATNDAASTLAVDGLGGEGVGRSVDRRTLGCPEVLAGDHGDECQQGDKGDAPREHGGHTARLGVRGGGNGQALAKRGATAMTEAGAG
jgi:hypothetical protein